MDKSAAGLDMTLCLGFGMYALDHRHWIILGALAFWFVCNAIRIGRSI